MKRRDAPLDQPLKMPTMIAFLRRRNSAARVDQPATDLPEVSQPMPLDDGSLVDDADNLSVTELSELEARALCAREDIPVFWPRPDGEKQR